VTVVRLVQDAGTRHAQIEAALALGASPRQSAADIIRRSVRLAMAPVVDSRKTMDIVFLPRAMTGMILAGADPLRAVRLQVVVVFMLLAAVSLRATLHSRPPRAACSRSCTFGGWRAQRGPGVHPLQPCAQRAGGPSAPRPVRSPFHGVSATLRRQCTGSCCHDPGTT